MSRLSHIASDGGITGGPSGSPATSSSSVTDAEFDKALHVISSRALLDALSRPQHTGICATIASELAVVPGRVVSMDELIDVVYRGVREPKSGPARVIVTMIHNLREAGFPILTHVKRGFSHPRGSVDARPVFAKALK